MHRIYLIFYPLIPPTSAKILEYVSAYAILGVLRSSNSISHIFIDEKSC